MIIPSHSREEVVSAARKYLGTRFKWRGRSEKYLDCVGLLVFVGRDLGYDIWDRADYTTNPEPLKLNAGLDSQSNPAPISPLRNGQIAKFRQSLWPMHCGIIAVEDGVVTVINANLHKKAVVEQPFSEWRNMLLEVRDYKGVQ